MGKGRDGTDCQFRFPSPSVPGRIFNFGSRPFPSRDGLPISVPVPGRMLNFGPRLLNYASPSWNYLNLRPFDSKTKKCVFYAGDYFIRGTGL